MSWSFGNAAPQTGNAAPQANAGPDLEEIQTETLGFLAIAGEIKLRLLPQSWPTDRLPPSTASLLSVSSAKGLLAAAGPETLVLASTESVRKAYTSGAPQENNTASFTPQASIPIPRVNQVAFSSDGSCLAIAAEEGGGLAIYDVQQLQQGQQESAFQMPTNGVSVRALAPNPAPEFSHLFAAVLANGQLVMANLKDRQLVSGSSGPVFREGVSCVSWSAKGKQLVAGLQDGTAAQYDHQGSEKARVPSPPQLSAQLPVTAIYWLANDDFFTVHSPASGDNNDSFYHIIHREKGSGSYQVQKFASDPVPPFGIRFPAHQFIQRLKGFPPNLDDMLVLSSTAGTDIGVFTRATSSLAPDMASENTVNVYTTTSMADDTRRAQMPMSSDGMGDTSPIGMALDLSATEMVKRPIPSDEEIEQTATPLPAIMLLDNEGRLSTWWVAYNDSIRQKTAYPGLNVAAGQNTPAMQSSAFQPTNTPSTSATPAPATQTSSAFGSSTFGQPSKPAAPAFGSSTFGQQSKPQGAPAFGASSFGQPSKPAFGAPSTPGFGSASAIGNKSSPWQTSGQTSGAFGKPAFGSTTPFGASNGASATPAFGQPSQPGQPSQTGSAFGQPSTIGGGSPFAKFGAQTGSPFGASAQGDSKPTQSPFASFGTSKPAPSPFASTGDNNTNKSSSPFASFVKLDEKPAESPFAAFGSQAEKSTSSPFASFANKDNKPASSPFAAFGSNENKPSPFGAFGQQGSKPAFGQPSNSFGAKAVSSFGAPTVVSQEADMADDDATEETSAQKPAEKPTGFGGFQLKSGFQGDGPAKDDVPKSKDAGQSLFGSNFGNALGETLKPPVTPVKKEPGTDETRLQDISTTPASPPTNKATEPEDAPLPPDFTKPSASETTEPESAPLPPDFTTAPPKKTTEAEDAPLPPDFTQTAKKTTESDAAPLPPDFLSAKPKQGQEEDLPPIAGSPPVDLGREASELSPSEGEDEDEEEGDEHEEGEEEDDEDGASWEDETGEDYDDDEDEEEADEELERETPKSTRTAATPAANAFGARLTFPGQNQISQQPAKSPVPSTTPAGMPKGPVFAPPVKESPRSPSPVRSTSTQVSRPPTRQAAPVSFGGLSQSRTSSRQNVNVAPPAAPETADLEDDEDARIRDILASDIVPTKTLDAFTAHQDYIGNTGKSGIAAQIENVYRDINSMVDTLGLNARTLTAFVRGQEELSRDYDLGQWELEQEEDWTFVEVSDLQSLEKDIEKNLDKGCITDVPDKLADLASLHSDTARLMTKAAETRRQLSTRTDPDKRAMQRNAPLDPEIELQQTQLRQTVAKAQKLLAEAEEAFSLLRAELHSLNKKDPNQRSAPTVEAITNTILKMTAMIEQKSGDVDVLEAQIRRLPRGLADLSLDDAEEDTLRSSTLSLRSSRRGMQSSKSMNALSTPGRGGDHRRSNLTGEPLGMSGMFGSRFRTPPASRRSMMGSSPASSMLGGGGGSARKKMADVSAEEVGEFHRRREQRKRVLRGLREVVENKGTRVVRHE
ncbi:hypothetical protein MBLNU457_g2835t1 [Dothideomycetes sp. NU457]